ncbi:LuxR family transcriptional regulator [Olivibacter sp. SDN3]|uniref:helix-turn-helix transcriptional regulator n=1 Tax=Olivibacter sp. SDN3 TaxID=2764720 RepID=UPI0016517A6E|nr:LuxR C-terminal-related transcriptional regulator [Olivibacter sp. SDN3]QNL51700.1 LuxR family transcriptional regulator [Olivibacter sp. SDN3]
MHLPVKPFIIVIILLFVCTGKGSAQAIYIDSLKQLLTQQNLSKGDEVIALCQLAHANFEQDLSLSFRLVDKALAIGETLDDGKGKALAFGTLIHLYVQRQEIQRAYESRDSALYYADRTEDRIAKGFVWFRSGWLDIIDDENDQSIRKLLQALNYFKGQGADAYESLVCHYLASFYGYGNDAAKQERYARMCYESALKSKQVDALNTAYYTLGQSYYDRFKLDTTTRYLLDSALAFNKKSLNLSARQAGRLIVQSNTAAVALNTANSYFQYFPDTYRDSAEKYIDVAMDIAGRTNLQEVLLNGYGLRSEYAVRDGDFNRAERILLQGLANTEATVVKMPVTKARIFQALSRIAENKGDRAAALHYLKQYIQFNKEAFNEEKLHSIQKIEAQYQSVKKEQEIAYLQQQAAFNKKRNILYVCLGFTGIALLLLLLSSYNYKLKASIRRQKLIDKEKQEAELRARLKEAEMLQLHAEQSLLKERQERLEKEVLAGSLQISEKNELLELLPTKVGRQSNLSIDEQIKRIVKQQKRMDKDFDEHKTGFFEVSPAFVERLQEKAKHTLTRLDLKYCAYILMGLPNKEISLRLNIEPKSIRMARYRIKQKLGLDKDQHLDHFIRSQQ